jgi:hypothetical protein
MENPPDADRNWLVSREAKSLAAGSGEAGLNYPGLSIAAARNKLLITPCPSATAPAGNPLEAAAKPPEGTHPDAGTASNLPVTNGATPEMVALSERIYQG